MMAVCVDPERVKEFLPHFGHYIKSAVDRVGITDYERIVRDLLNGCALLWLACEENTVHAAAVTALVDDVCEIVACGGRGLPAFLPLIGRLEQYARDEQCTSMRIIGRRGWLRVLKNYKQKAVILERPLDGR